MFRLVLVCMAHGLCYIVCELGHEDFLLLVHEGDLRLVREDVILLIQTEDLLPVQEDLLMVQEDLHLGHCTTHILSYFYSCQMFLNTYLG